MFINTFYKLIYLLVELSYETTEHLSKGLTHTEKLTLEDEFICALYKLEEDEQFKMVIQFERDLHLLQKNVLGDEVSLYRFLLLVVLTSAFIFI